MCRFSYNQFALCGHRVIETNYCQPAKWFAGIEGKLTSCGEDVFRYEVARVVNSQAPIPTGFIPEVVATYAWVGVEGMCKACNHEQKIPETAMIVNGRSTPLSSFANLAVVAQIVAQRKDAPRRGFPTPEHPMVYMPTLTSSVFDLLGISDQYPSTDQNTCKILTFPASSFLYTSDSWVIAALVEGQLMRGKPNQYLSTNCGLTPRDRTFIDSQLVRGKSIDEVYNLTYAHRGMPKMKFVDAAQRGEIKPALHAAGNKVVADPGQPANLLGITPNGTALKLNTARSCRSSTSTIGNTPVETPKSHKNGVRKISTSPRKVSASPSKVSAMERELSGKSVAIASSKGDAAIDPRLLDHVNQEPIHLEEALKTYDTLSMPPVQAKSPDARHSLKSFKQRLLNASEMTQAMLPDASNGQLNGCSATMHSQSYNDVVSADSELSFTPIKGSPKSFSSVNSSPINSLKAAPEFKASKGKASSGMATSAARSAAHDDFDIFGAFIDNVDSSFPFEWSNLPNQSNAVSVISPFSLDFARSAHVVPAAEHQSIGNEDDFDFSDLFTYGDESGSDANKTAMAITFTDDDVLSRILGV